MAAKKSAASLAWKVFIGVLVTLLIVILLAEFGLRWFMSNQLKEQFSASAQQQGVTTDAEPEVSFGPSPLIFGILSGRIAQVDMSTPSTLEITDSEIKGQPAADIHIEGMTIEQNPVADRMVTTTAMPDDYLLVMFQDAIATQSGVDALRNMVVTDLRATAADDAITAEFGGGLATLSLKPSARDGQLALEATNSTLFGMNLPEQATNSISQALSESMEGQLSQQLRIDAVQVLDGEIELTVSGDNVPLNNLNDQLSTPPGEQTGQQTGEQAAPGNQPSS